MSDSKRVAEKGVNRKYYQRWEVRIRGERIGEVLAATSRAACMRAVHRFKITKEEDQRELSVHRIEERTARAYD